jgi:hypothetical protein
MRTVVIVAGVWGVLAALGWAFWYCLITGSRGGSGDDRHG